MTFLVPGFFYAALAVAAGVIALHFIVTRQPRAAVLPTARFVPDLAATAIARARRPSDLLLMLLRVVLVLATGAALARPVMKPSRSTAAKVILMDASRSVSDITSAADSVRAVYRDGDAVIVFDSTARLVTGSVNDSLHTLKASERKGNLSGAIVAAMRAASTLRERADSIELVIVSSLAAEEWDAATDSVRRLWPGRARLVRMPPAADSLVPGRGAPGFVGLPGDPLGATATLAMSSTRDGARIVRERPSPADSQWLSADDSRVLVEWMTTDRPSDAVARTPADTANGVMSDSALVVSVFERKWKFPADSLSGAVVVARWIDGEPAAVERGVGTGCLRSVAIPVTAVGDMVIRPDFVALVSAITAPCAGQGDARPLPAPAIASLTGTGGLAPREAFRPGTDAQSSLTPWLIAVAIAAALAELVVRDRRTKRVHVSQPIRATATEILESQS